MQRERVRQRPSLSPSVRADCTGALKKAWFILRGDRTLNDADGDIRWLHQLPPAQLICGPCSPQEHCTNTARACCLWGSEQMDFLLALVAPVLTKVLYFVYLSGVATSFHLRLGRRKQVHGLPPLPSRGLRSRASAGEAKPHAQVQMQEPQQAGTCSQLSKPAFSCVKLTGPPFRHWQALMISPLQGNGLANTAPRAPPNDPERQGNIWQRYEQLETTSQELTKVNQQIVYERNKYRKVPCHRAP